MTRLSRYERQKIINRIVREFEPRAGRRGISLLATAACRQLFRESLNSYYDGQLLVFYREVCPGRAVGRIDQPLPRFRFWNVPLPPEETDGHGEET